MGVNNTTNFATNIDQWLSEYPRFKAIITHPLHSWTFMLNPPPREENHEWDSLIAQMDDTEPEQSTGGSSSNIWTDPPLEPPF